MKKRILFVDDEPAIRATLPAILKREGFDVTAAATVAAGLRYISERKFDALLADLNIGTAGDGFTLVSAMRRTQPDAVTIILTGFPDFETALEAIRKQVDDYLTKPADIPSLVAKIKEKIANPSRIRELPTKRVADVLRENSDRIVENWLAESEVDSDLRVLPLSREQRLNNLPDLIAGLVEMLETGSDQMPGSQMQGAVKHGTQRARLQSFRIALLVSEARLLQQVITEVLERELLTLELSTLIPDVLKVGEGPNALLEQSLQAFVRERRIEVA
jgi:DNA-binding response OmpR family regulator